jgi:hypothetical protein
MPKHIFFSLQIFDPEKSARESFRLVNRVEPSFVIQGQNLHLLTCSSDQKTNPETTNPDFFHELAPLASLLSKAIFSENSNIAGKVYLR